MKPLFSGTVALALLACAFTSGKASAANYTIQLINQTGLDSSKYSLYAMGFSYNSNLVMNSSGVFVSQSSGTVSSYKVGSGGLTQILLDTATAFTGGRLYFFVVPNGQAAPSVAFNTQPTNPPDSSFPPYSIVEITVPANSPATLDLQTVDGFIFPITATLNGSYNTAGKQYGQPVKNQAVGRDAVFTAYSNFMKALGNPGQPYLDMVFGSFAGQKAGILNPGAYLLATNSINNYVNITSSLNTILNADTNTLFGTNTLSIQGVASNPSDSGTAIATDVYTVSSTSSQIYPGSSVSIPALKFQGTATPSNTFTVFNPVGVTVATNSNGNAITGSIVGSTLTLNASVSTDLTNYYVAGAGISPSGDNYTTQVTMVSGNTLTLNQNFPTPPAANSTYIFCKLPNKGLFMTPGQMIFANAGLFADSTIQFASGSASATVLANLENQIVSALNRGVAIDSSALAPGTAGGTSKIWGDQTKWYPSGAKQNFFSLFMHTGKVDNQLIFFAPAGAGSFKNANGDIMGSAYGFAYDENGGPVPPAPSGQPEVPSKFDQNVPVGATIQITFGPWNSAPEVTIQGKKTIHTSKNKVKIKGSAIGQKLFVKYKKKPGKQVKKKVKIKNSGDWVFSFKPVEKNTVLKFYSEASGGKKSKVQKVKVIKN